MTLPGALPAPRNSGRDAARSVLPALALSAVAVGITASIEALRKESPFPLPLAAVAVSAWYGGLFSGLLATAVGAIGYALAISPGFRFDSSEDVLRLVIYCAAGAVVSAASHRLRAAHAGSVAERETLLTRAEDARQRLVVLSEISDVLMSSFEYRETLPGVARLAVPRAAECCAICYSDGGEIVLHVTHVDPAVEKRLFDLWAGQTVDPSSFPGESELIDHPAGGFGPEAPGAIDAPGPAAPLAFLGALGSVSAATAPFRLRGRNIGFLVLANGSSGRRFGQDDLALATLIGRRCTIAIENSRLYESQGRAIDRVSSLQRLTAALAGTMTEEEVAEVIVSEGVEALGAGVGVVSILNEAGTYFRNLRIRGYPEEVARDWPGFAADGPFPVADAVKSGHPILLRNLEERKARYPNLGGFRTSYAGGALVAIPMFLRERPVGGIGFIFPDAREFSPEDHEFLLALARECAQALERARLFQKGRDAVLLRDDFLSVAGHELRTPAHAVTLIAESMLRRARADELPDRFVEGLERLIEAVGRLTRLTSDLLDVTHIADGRLTLQRERFDLSDLVSEVLRRFEEVAKESGCRIDSRLVPAIGNWDRTRLDQLITNVVGNACKYGAAAPIEVTLAPADDRVVLSVKDHGIGISPEDQSRLFRRFERFETRRKFGGMGLGLWISQRIVAAHGGEIRVESAPGQGANFQIELPREG